MRKLTMIAVLVLVAGMLILTACTTTETKPSVAPDTTQDKTAVEQHQEPVQAQAGTEQAEQEKTEPAESQEQPEEAIQPSETETTPSVPVSKKELDALKFGIETMNIEDVQTLSDD